MFPVLLAASLPATVAAEGLYASIGGGISYLQDADNTNFLPTVDVESSYDRGWVLSGAVGYALPTGFRLELEVAYRRFALDKLKINDDGGLGVALGGGPLNGVTAAADGHETALSLMANIWYDIPTGTRFTPYVGGGVGAARVALEEVGVGGIEIVDGHDTVVGFQAGFGLAYAVAPNVSVTVDYRFFGTSPATFTDITGDFQSEFHSHSIMGGIRVGF